MKVLKGEHTGLKRLAMVKGALPALAYLARNEPVKMKHFVEGSGTVFDTAHKLRLAFETMGLLVVSEEVVRGARSEMEIRLTPLGKEIAGHALAMDEAFAKHAAREAKKKG